MTYFLLVSVIILFLFYVQLHKKYKKLLQESNEQNRFIHSNTLLIKKNTQKTTQLEDWVESEMISLDNDLENTNENVYGILQNQKSIADRLNNIDDIKIDKHKKIKIDINQILDKINLKGYDCLSEDEIKILKNYK